MGSGNIKPFDRADKSLFDQMQCYSLGSCSSALVAAAVNLGRNPASMSCSFTPEEICWILILGS